MHKKLNNKGFTLIELIVVIAIIGILVTLAMPRFKGITEKAQDIHIQNDIKVAEGKVLETLIIDEASFETWGTDLDGELTLAMGEKKLYDVNGPALTIEDNGYKEIPQTLLKDIRTNLKGKFYANSGGKAYYVHIKAHKGEIVDEVVDEDDTNLETEHFKYSVSGGEVSINGLTEAGIVHFARNVIMPDTIDDKPVTAIGDSAFEVDRGYPAQVITVTFPVGLKTIGVSSFAGNGLTNLVIPDSITSLGASAFRRNPITTLSISKNMTSIEAYTFNDNSLSEIVIPENIKSIGDSAFRTEEGFAKTITMPAGVNLDPAWMYFVESGDTFNTTYASGGGGVYKWASGNWALQDNN